MRHRIWRYGVPISMTQNSFHEIGPFHKLQGAGNDFVVLDLLRHPQPPSFDLAHVAELLCDRHFGVGGDGLLTLEAATTGDALRMRMWNPDGSEDMCGNGLRCVAALAWRHQHVTTPVFSVQTLAGSRQIEVLNPGLISAAMGQPIFAPSEVPVVTASGRENAIEFEIAVGERKFVATTLSTGSTHTVIFLKAPLTEADFQKLGPLLEHYPLFPTRTSIMWAVPDGPNRFAIRIWERGVGETLACGTGASAVAVAARVTGRADGPTQIQSRGGVLSVDWAPGQEIFLTGPAEYVFEGVWRPAQKA